MLLLYFLGITSIKRPFLAAFAFLPNEQEESYK